MYIVGKVILNLDGKTISKVFDWLAEGKVKRGNFQVLMVMQTTPGAKEQLLSGKDGPK